MGNTNLTTKEIEKFYKNINNSLNQNIILDQKQPRGRNNIELYILPFIIISHTLLWRSVPVMLLKIDVSIMFHNRGFFGPSPPMIKITFGNCLYTSGIISITLILSY